MKSILSLLALLSVTLMGFSQSPSSNSGVNVATVNIILHDVQELIVNQAENVIDLVYDSRAKYEDGVSVVKSNHLQAFSTGSFNIEAAVWQENLITPLDISVNSVLLSRTFAPIYSNLNGNTLLDITYSAKGDFEYIDKNKQTYTTQVIYTITTN